MGGIAPLEQEVGRKPAVRKQVRGGGDQIPVVMVVMVIIFHKWKASDRCMAFGPYKSETSKVGARQIVSERQMMHTSKWCDQVGSAMAPLGCYTSEGPVDRPLNDVTAG